MKIMIVEDDPVSRKLLEHFLSPYGECRMAETGREAVELFAKSLADDDPFDLICLDIIMPEMDGLEALIKIRSMETEHGSFNYRRAKVIVITSLDDLRNAMASLKLMCQEYIQKPVSREELIAKLCRLGLISKGRGHEEAGSFQ